MTLSVKTTNYYKFRTKIQLIKLFNILKDTGDKSGCINDFFNICNSNFGLSIPIDFTEQDGIGEFLSKIDLSNMSYQNQTDILEYIEKL